MVKVEFEKMHTFVTTRDCALREKFADEVVWGAF